MNYFLSQVWAVLMGHCALPLSTWRKIGEHVLWKATGSIDQFKIVFCHPCDIIVTEFPARSKWFVFSSLIFAASTCKERSVMCARVEVCGRVVFAGIARERRQMTLLSPEKHALLWPLTFHNRNNIRMCYKIKAYRSTFSSHLLYWKLSNLI